MLNAESERVLSAIKYRSR